MTVVKASEMHFNASRSLTQPLLDCILYLTQYLYDASTLPCCANQCILGKVHLTSEASTKAFIFRHSLRVHKPQGIGSGLRVYRLFHTQPRTWTTLQML
jgi:hypothetical protein